jgi:outer membrane receptor protein involved in Fe transport
LQSTHLYNFNSASGAIVGYAPSTILSNPDLKWEVTKQTDLGLDLRFLENRLSVTIDWYNKNTTNLLVLATAPFVSGTGTQYRNAGLVNNHGTEIEIGWKGSVKGFSYSVAGNVATIKNEVKEGTGSRLGGQQLSDGTYITYFDEGYPIWYIRGYKLDHIDQTNGMAIYQNLGTGDNKEMIGSGMPDFTFGLTLNAAFKGFDLTVFCNGTKGNDIFYGMQRHAVNTFNRLSELYTDSWTPSNTNAKYPAVEYQDQQFLQSDLMIFDGSYFKISQIQLGYSIPKSLLQKIKGSSLRAYVTLDNWFTFTKYPGLDPSITANSTLGLGVDVGGYPNPRTISTGVEISF